MRRDDTATTEPAAPDVDGNAAVDKAAVSGAPEAPSAGPAGEAPVTPDPEKVAEAREALAAAEHRAASAARAERHAEDDLADAEATVAVLEYKVEDAEADEKLKRWQKAAAQQELDRARRAFKRAGEQLEEAKADTEAADQIVTAAAARLRKAEATPAIEPEPTPPRFASLPVFVEKYVLPNWIHRLGEHHAGRWCPRWWQHAEAITRLEALWEAFEVMRMQPPPSLSTWLRDHFDPHMRMLTDNAGVFYRCDAEKNIHENKPAWPAEPAPAGLFATDKDAAVQADGNNQHRGEGNPA